MFCLKQVPHILWHAVMQVQRLRSQSGLEFMQVGAI
jgi:hypothetical protein